MDESYYVPFEPGVGVETVMMPKHVTARVMESVPEVSAVKTQAADAWFDTPTVEDLSYVRTQTPGGPPTRVAIFRDKTQLFVAFDCIEPAMNRVNRLVPRDAEKGRVEILPDIMPRTLDYDENVKVLLDDAHDKTVFYGLQVNINGARHQVHYVTAMNWTVFATSTYREMEGLLWESDVVESENGWRAAIKIDLGSVGRDLDAQPTMGLELVRLRNVECWKAYAWSDLIHQSHANAAAFGDLYLADTGAAVTRIDWGDRESGRNRMKVTVASSKPRKVMLKVKAHDREGLQGAPYEAETESAAVEIPAGGEAVLEADYLLPWDHPRMFFTLEVVDVDSGESLYRAQYPLRDHGDVRVRKPYARVSREGAENPKPGDERFHEKKAEWILTRLPKFTRKTTAQGAPSDFTLAAEDGSVTFNLMETGALKRIADYISTLFEEDTDRLVATAIFTNDDWVTVHAAPRVGMQRHLTPLSELRLGGGHCYSRAVIGAGIVNELIDPATGENHEAWPTLVLGHVITAISRGEDYTFIDPSFGHFFYNADNTDLATSAELAANHELITRVVKGEKRLANYIRPDAHVRLDEGTVVWPAGAPPK